MAEHVPGTPYQYRHGWIKISEDKDKTVVRVPIADAKKFANQGFLWRSTEDMNQLTESIRKNGFDEKYPLNVSPTIGLADGNHRLRAAENAGLTHVPMAFHKSVKSSDTHSDTDTAKGYGKNSFYDSQRKVATEEEEYQAYIKSPEYKAKIAATARARKKKQKDFLTEAAARLRKEGKTELAAEAQAEADAIELTKKQLGMMDFAAQAKPSKRIVHTVLPGPQSDATVRNIAQILMYAYSSKSKTLTHQVAAITHVLEPHGITSDAILPALGLANRGTRAKPNSRAVANGLRAASDTTRRVAADDLYYRSAYVMNASKRIQESLNAGLPQRKALAKEYPNMLLHEQARKGRLNAAANVQKATESFGPLLGWYLNPLLNNESECIAANGHNFYAEEGTVIGLPGSVHSNCGCKAGPPIPGAAMVNDVLGNVIRFGKAKKFKLRAKSA